MGTSRTKVIQDGHYMRHGARWEKRTWADETIQHFLPGSSTFIEKYPAKVGYFIVDRGERARDVFYPPVLSGPYKTLDEARHVILVSHMVCGGEMTYIG